MPTECAPVPAAVSGQSERLASLWERTGDRELGRLSRGLSPREDREPASDQEWVDWLSTCLMAAFKKSADPQVFALLVELNQQPFLRAIRGRLRRYGSPLSAHDVLQDVYVNIFRYPARFNSDRADAFRNWGHRIVRNTLIKALKVQARHAGVQLLEEDLVLPADPSMKTPALRADEAERATAVDQAYLLYLDLYYLHFQQLSPRERRALTLVEVHGASYRETAEDLGIRLENLKMVIFRGRRKVFRGMRRTLDDLGSLGCPR